VQDTYNTQGWLTTRASRPTSNSADWATVQFEYDGNGNQASVVDSLGQTTSYGYDALNRLTSLTYTTPAPGTATTPNVSYAYDANSRRISMTDGTGTTTSTYDEAGRLLSVTSPHPSGTKTVAYRYDLDGNRTKVLYSDNTVVTYSFDKAGQLSTMLDWASRQTSYQYLPDRLLQTANNFNGTTGTYSHDHARRLTQVHHQQGATTISQHRYTLDATGTRTQVDEVLAQVGGSPTNPTSAYGHDRPYRLTSDGVTGATYTYDPAGNRLTRTQSGVTTSYSYDRADRLSAAGSTSYTVNAAGTLTNRGSDSFTYDQAHRLTSATVVGGTTTSYTYDGAGKRASSTVGTNPTTHFVYDTSGTLPVLLDDGARKYVWGAKGLA
jgi:YD repeat-containing protein